MTNLPVPGRSLLLMGPPGGGKSTTARQALVESGSGVVVLAPGVEEATSYLELQGSEKYVLRGFNDPGFLPSIGVTEATGHKEALLFLRTVYFQARYDLGLVSDAKQLEILSAQFGQPRGELRYRMLVNDTISGVALLAINAVMADMRIKVPPAALSPDGAAFYTGLQNKMEEWMRMLDACRGMGMDLIATSHVKEKELAATAAAEHQVGKAWVAYMLGSFREALPRAFDLVGFVEVEHDGKYAKGGVNDPEHPRHVLRWASSSKRPTKSRAGLLASTETIASDWSVVRAALDAALARRAARG